MSKSVSSVKDNKVVLAPDSSIVASNVPDLRARIRAAIENNSGGLVLDLAKVDMIDSTGIGLLVAAHNSLAKTGMALELINTSQDMLDLLRSLRLDQHFGISDAGAKRQ